MVDNKLEEVKEAAELGELAAMSEQERMNALQNIIAKTGDYKALAALSRKFDLADKAKEKAELDAKRAALDAVKGKVGAAIHKVVQKFWDAGDLDVADIVAYTWDLDETTPTVRLLKTAPKAARAGGGGGGKKFDVGTEEMLSRHGTEEYKDGMTYIQAWESSTDKNWKYSIRKALLKLEDRL